MMHTPRWKKLMFAASLAVLPACGMEEPNSPEAKGLDPKAPTELGQTRAELVLGSETYALPARGEYGGTPATVACPANHVAVGLHGTVNTYITSLGLVCRALNADGTLGASVSIAAAGGAWGNPFSSQCPDGMAIVGFPGHYGWYVDSLGVHCAAPNAWRTSGQVQASVAEVGYSYSGNPFSDVCPSQSVVTQLNVRHGDNLDQEQATCTRYAVPSEVYVPVNFEFGDARRTTSTGDWAFSNYKSECASGERVTGLSLNPTSRNTRTALCSASGDSRFPHNSCYARDFSGTPANGDWDPWYYKAECGTNEFVAGVAQDTSHSITSILCCPGTVARNSCAALVFDGGDARESSTSGDWDVGSWKGECGPGRYAAGLSRSTSSGTPHALLCCSP